MKNETQHPEISCSLVDVVSAWFVGAAVIFALLVISLIQEIPQPSRTDNWIMENYPVRIVDAFADKGDLCGGVPHSPCGIRVRPLRAAR